MDKVRLVDIRDTPLSVDEVHKAASDPAAGGTALFIGAVRDLDEDRSVASLDYDAHPSALDRLYDVAASVAQGDQVLAVAVLHRIGHLEIGDLALVAAVSCPHRGEAFDAVRRLVDELKATVPIWKRQAFTDGDQAWVGTP